MLTLSQADIQSADFSFYPALEKRASKRQVYLITKSGIILKGIIVHKKRGERYYVIDVPPVLVVTNRPEHGIAEIETLPKLGEVEQVLGELTRETLKVRLRERLSRGA